MAYINFKEERFVARNQLEQRKKNNENDYKMLKSFNGGVIKKHNKILDELHKKEYESLVEFIDEIIKKEGN